MENKLSVEVYTEDHVVFQVYNTPKPTAFWL